MVCSHTLRLLQREFEIDTELHFVLTGEDCQEKIDIPPVDLPPVPKHYRYEETPVDEQLFTYFHRHMEEILATRSGEVPSFTGHSIGDIQYTPADCKFMEVRKDIAIPDAIRVYRRIGFTPVVGRLVKHLKTSAGKQRMLYPMHLSYETALRVYFRDARIVHGVTSHTQYPETLGWRSYDVKSCDRTLWPYFVNWAIRRGIQDILPLMFTDCELYALDQFPSGIYGTNLVTNAFTNAVCDLAGLKTSERVIHGDGVLCRTPIQSRYLRYNGCDNLNGFNLNPGGAYYSNEHRLHVPRCKKARLYGKERAAVLLASLRILGARKLPPIMLDVTIRGRPWQRWSSKDIVKFCERRKTTPPHLIEQLGPSYRPRASNWDLSLIHI